MYSPLLLSPLSDTKDCIFDHYVLAGQVHRSRLICVERTIGIQGMKESIPGKHTVPVGEGKHVVKLDLKQALALKAPPPEAGSLVFSPHQAQPLSAKKN